MVVLEANRVLCFTSVFEEIMSDVTWCVCVYGEH